VIRGSLIRAKSKLTKNIIIIMGHLIDYPCFNWYICIEKAVLQTGKGIDPLFKYNCLCVKVNPIVGHFIVTGMIRREVNHPLIKTAHKKIISLV
jgi:hypothetical protein